MIGAFSQRLGRLHKFARSAGPVRGPRLLWQITRKSSPVLASLPGGRAIELRPRTSDQYMLEEVFIDRAYDVGLGFEPEYVVDAGANIGCYTTWVATRHPDARIVAVEPDPGNLLMLARNTAGLDHVRLVAGALWPEDRPLLLDASANVNGGYAKPENPFQAADYALLVGNTVPRDQDRLPQLRPSAGGRSGWTGQQRDGPLTGRMSATNVVQTPGLCDPGTCLTSASDGGFAIPSTVTLTQSDVGLELANQTG